VSRRRKRWDGRISSHLYTRSSDKTGKSGSFAEVVIGARNATSFTESLDVANRTPSDDKDACQAVHAHRNVCEASQIVGPQGGHFKRLSRRSGPCLTRRNGPMAGSVEAGSGRAARWGLSPQAAAARSGQKRCVRSLVLTSTRAECKASLQLIKLSEDVRFRTLPESDL
jgi:hypothetical protein